MKSSLLKPLFLFYIKPREAFEKLLSAPNTLGNTLIALYTGGLTAFLLGDPEGFQDAYTAFRYLTFSSPLNGIAECIPASFCIWIGLKILRTPLSFKNIFQVMVWSIFPGSLVCIAILLPMIVFEPFMTSVFGFILIIPLFISWLYYCLLGISLIDSDQSITRKRAGLAYLLGFLCTFGLLIGLLMLISIFRS